MTFHGVFTSERGALPWRGITSWLAQRFIDELPSFVRDAHGLVDRASKLLDLPGEILKRGLQIAPQPSTTIGEEEETDHGPNRRSCEGHCYLP